MQRGRPKDISDAERHRRTPRLSAISGKAIYDGMLGLAPKRFNARRWPRSATCAESIPKKGAKTTKSRRKVDQNLQKWFPKFIWIRGWVADAFFERLGEHLGGQKPQSLVFCGPLLATILVQNHWRCFSTFLICMFIGHVVSNKFGTPICIASFNC